MRAMEVKLCVAGTVIILLGACGGGGATSENERRYAAACVAGSGEAYKTLCECSSRIVAPKLTPAELTAMEKMATPGQAWTEEKARQQGFSLQDAGTFGQKKQESFAEMSRSCGGQI